MTTTTTKEIEVKKTDLKATHTFFPIQELPVKSVRGVRLLHLETWEHAVCIKTLRHWKETGSVMLYGKETLHWVIEEAWEKMTLERAKEIVESLIQNGIFREEEEWLVPLEPLLRCATPHLIERNTPGPDPWCFTYTYYDIAISLR